jgi:uridine kinase
MKRPLDSTMVNDIKKKMKDLCYKDLKFKQISVSRSDAYEYVKSLGENEKMLNYLFMTHDSITMYELDDDYNYFFYIMPPSTGYLKRFDLTYVAPNGIVLSYPINNIVPKFVPSPQVLTAFKTY